MLNYLSECSHNDYMATHLVGARELKTRLGTYLRRIRQGQTIRVTDRGQPVAELRSLGTDQGLEAAFAAWTANGLVTRPRARSLQPFRPIESRGPSAESAVLEERADRV